MMIWLPASKFGESARLLDPQRLAQQINNAHNIARMLFNRKHYPSSVLDATYVKMWKGYEYSLCLLGLQAINEHCAVRGNPILKFVQDNQFRPMIKELKGRGATKSKPPWAGDADFHWSHRANLIAADHHQYDHLRVKGWELRVPLLWPELDGEDSYRLMLSETDHVRLLNGDFVLGKGLSLTEDGEVFEEEA